MSFCSLTAKHRLLLRGLKNASSTVNLTARPWPLAKEEKVEIISIPIEDVIPYDHNPRHNDQAVDAVARSIEEFGFRQPIVVTDDYVIEQGHCDMKDLVLAPMRAGSGLFFHSLLPHYTAPNRSTTWRRAIALSYMSARSRYTGDGEGPQYFTVQGDTFDGCVQ